MLRLLFISLFLFVTLSEGSRCTHYVQQVRKAHYSVFGLDFPYWFGVGQLEQESGCRNIISNDGVGSQGLAQITYRIWQKYLQEKGINEITSLCNQLKAQAWIMKNSKAQAYSSHMWVWYQVYNGGGAVNKEISRARKVYGIREVPHAMAREFCKRKDVVFSSGQRINACDINYEYSEKVFKYGLKYKLFDTDYKFW